MDIFGDPASAFIGTYCTDILPTLSASKDEQQDNYLQKMYLSSTYSNTTNYVIFKDSEFVSMLSILTNIQWSKRNFSYFLKELAPKTLGEVIIEDFEVKYDFTDRGFIIGYYTNRVDGKQ